MVTVVTMVGMDVGTVRAAKIKDLVTQAGGPQAFADRYGTAPNSASAWSRAQVNQWVMERPKPIGAKLAREIERRVGLPVGWMDQAAAPAVSLPQPTPSPQAAALDESTAAMLIRRLEGDVDQLRMVVSSLLFTLAARDRDLLEAVETELRSKPPSYQDRGMHAIFLLLLDEARKAAAAAPGAARPRAGAGSR